MSVNNISPEQAKDILDSDTSSVYIDVRTEQEFVNGHVPKSINIPVVWPDPATRQMKPNPDFIKAVSSPRVEPCSSWTRVVLLFAKPKA